MEEVSIWPVGLRMPTTRCARSNPLPRFPQPLPSYNPKHLLLVFLLLLLPCSWPCCPCPCAGEHESMRRLKTEILVQMEGVDPTRAERRVLLVGATNRPEELDEAARRRMPKQLYIPLPDAGGCGGPGLAWAPAGPAAPAWA